MEISLGVLQGSGFMERVLRFTKTVQNPAAVSTTPAMCFFLCFVVFFAVCNTE
jgi:hypothetical protein